MYGWIETGGFFNNTSSNDIVFRTASEYSKIAIGNPTATVETPAVLTVLHNKIGINTNPNDAYIMTVNGDSSLVDGQIDLTNSTNQCKITCTSEEMQFWNSNQCASYINVQDSRIATDSIVTRSIFSTKKVLYNVSIIDVVPSEISDINNPLAPVIPSLDITVGLKYINDLTEGLNIVVGKTTLVINQVLEALDNLKIRVKSFSPFADQIQLSPGISVDITLLTDWLPSRSFAQFETLYFSLYVSTYTFTNSLVDNGQVAVTFILKNQDNPIQDDLPINSLYTISNNESITNPSLVLKLTRFQRFLSNSQIGYHMEFTTIECGRLDLVAAGLEAILEQISPGVQRVVNLFPLNYIEPPVIKDDNVVVGYTIDAISQRICFQLAESRLSTLTSSYIAKSSGTNLMNYAIDYIVLGSRPIQYDVTAYKPFTNNSSVVVDIKGVQDDVFDIKRQSITYRFKGVPMRVVECNRISSIIADFVLDNILQYEISLTRFTDGFLYWLDNGDDNAFIVKLSSVYKSSTGAYSITIETTSYVLDSPYFFDVDRIIYLTPLMYTQHTKLGNNTNNTYIPKSLSIGTYQSKDTLTLNGNMTMIGGLTLYNKVNGVNNNFNIEYTDSNVLNMNNMVKITLSNVDFSQSINIKDNVSATNYIKYSDRRLKRNIRDTNLQDDLELIRKIQIKSFKFQKSDDYVKGVIAQDIYDVVPQAVKTSPYVIEFDDPIAVEVQHDSSCLLVACEELDENIKKGAILRVVSIDKKTTYDVVVGNVTYKYFKLDGKVFKTFIIRVAADIENLPNEVLVVGVIDDVYTVNYDILYLTAINAIKELDNKIKRLYEIIGH